MEHNNQMNNAWWLTPDTVCRFLKVLGFPNVTVTYHRQKHKDIAPRLYTASGESKSVAPYKKRPQ